MKYGECYNIKRGEYQIARREGNENYFEIMNPRNNTSLYFNKKEAKELQKWLKRFIKEA